MPVSVVVGGQFGSEGKGKVASTLPKRIEPPRWFGSEDRTLAIRPLTRTAPYGRSGSYRPPR